MKIVLLLVLWMCMLGQYTIAINPVIKNKGIVNGGLFQGNQLLTVDITLEYPEKEFYLQEVTDIEYIPLETRNDALLDGNACQRFRFSDSLMVTYNGKEGSVFIFNRKGKLVSVFNHIGRGAGEYVGVHKLTVDFKNKEIFIYDLLQSKILVYDFAGIYRRTLNVPNHVFIGVMFDYNVDYLIGNDIYNVSSGAATVNLNPYFLLSKKDGKIIPLNLFF